MLNFYDTEAVKAFTLKILVENQELKERAEYESRNANDWFRRFQEVEAKNKDLEAKVAALEGGSENE